MFCGPSFIEFQRYPIQAHSKGTEFLGVDGARNLHIRDSSHIWTFIPTGYLSDLLSILPIK